MPAFHHDHIVPIIGSYVERPPLSSVYMYPLRVLVFPRLQPLPTPFASAAQLLSCGRDLLRALAFLHSRGVLHLDVKPTNMLLDAKRGRFVLCDMGSACFETEEPYHVPRTTESFAAWEVRGRVRDAEKQRRYKTTPSEKPYKGWVTTAADIYSAGVTLEYLLDSNMHCGRTLLTPRQQEEMASLIASMKQDDPEARPSATQALGNNMFTGINLSKPNRRPANRAPAQKAATAHLATNRALVPRLPLQPVDVNVVAL
jgi:serine/threonine protein kinase